MKEEIEQRVSAPRAHGCLRLFGGLVLLVAVLGCTLPPAYHYIDRYRYRPTENFIGPKWKAGNLKYRYSVMPYVADQIVAVGMTADEVRQLLGEPDRFAGDGSGNEWQYLIMQPGFRGLLWERMGLYLRFDADGKVELIGKDRYFGSLN